MGKFVGPSSPNMLAGMSKVMVNRNTESMGDLFSQNVMEAVIVELHWGGGGGGLCCFWV